MEFQVQYGVSDECDLVIVGLLIFFDLLKEIVGLVIVVLCENGVVVKVFIGDNLVVSVKICCEVGLDVGELLFGCDIDLMDDVIL